MGYSGTIVVGRSERPLVELRALRRFGYRHHWLRQLGDGWQLVETAGWDDPPDLVGATRALSAESGSPSFGAYVNDSDCAGMCVDDGPLTHLPDVDAPCAVYSHGAGKEPEPRAVDEVVDEFVAWSGRAGLTADAARIRHALTGDEVADELLFRLVEALGVRRIGRTEKWAFGISSRPYALITSYFGLATRARARLAWDEAPPEPWETAAIRLDEDLWAALYRPDADVATLTTRVAEVLEAYNAHQVQANEPDRRHEELFAMLTAGTLNPDHEDDDHGRRWADRRATAE
ncbi:hypothetical protein ACQP2F_00390 [Actinoplanes sp. CA-030573]|uniref:hypothetical protein n=1 Tax=Actinoplanes sp. CA-030573 TaxID=3239898 RepID=UPI003D8A5ADE